MAVTQTHTWAGGVRGAPSSGFSLTDDRGVVTPVAFDTNTVANIANPVHRAVAEELANQAGAASGTVTVTIA